MEKISEFPYFEVQFNKEGGIHKELEVKQVLDFLAQDNAVTDLFVISHGWNNDMAEARVLYKNLFARVRAGLKNNRPPGLETRKFAVLGILWPSKKFADDELISSGAANVDLPRSEEAEIKKQLEALKGVFDLPDADARLERAKNLVDQLDRNEQAAVDLVDLIRSLPHKQEIHPDDNSDRFFQIPGHTLVDQLSRPDVPVPTAGSMGGAADFNSSVATMSLGEAAGFSLFGGIKSAIRQVLNFTTYYQMKERAGTVGKKGAYQVLAQIRKLKPTLKIHLIGHSFGGRLVTAVADGPEGREPLNPASMVLLQAAFSHHGFAPKFDGTRNGFFRNVISGKKVTGPILITHTINDKAVGLAYPVASKLSGDDASNFGGPDSAFGGIGRNGAQKTPEVVNTMPLGPVSTDYTFQAGKLYNLKADKFILDHSDVTKAEVAHVVLCAVATT